MSPSADKVKVRLYASGSGVVLIGMDWKPAPRQAFYGFAIQRTPGFHEPIPGADGSASRMLNSWLENRLSFRGAADTFMPSNVAPVQKYQWWDARFHPDEDAGTTFVYQVIPMTGHPDALLPVPGASGTASVTFPTRSSGNVGVWFNRPFVSSQAMTRLLQRLKVNPNDPSTFTPAAQAYVRNWLANGLEKAVPEFAAAAGPGRLAGAVYHLTDEETIAALVKRRGDMVLHWKNPPKSRKQPEAKAKARATSAEGGDTTNEQSSGALQKAGWKVCLRQHSGNFMHDKILLRRTSDSSQAMLMGSANMTPEGYTTQANVLHVWSVPALAQLYDARVSELLSDTPAGKLHAQAGWSKPIGLGGNATARVFFSPEADGSRRQQKGTWEPASIQPIVDAIGKATSSVVVCLFDPTDEQLMNSVMAAMDRNKAAFGLLNTLPMSEPSPTTKAGKPTPGYVEKKKLFAFMRKHTALIAAQGYLSDPPTGFLQEIFALPSKGRKQAKPPRGKGQKGRQPYVFNPASVRVHHKFVLIDGETDHPVLFTGSANLSKNSATKNDENTLWIQGHLDLARTYLAEFMRLFEHYRFRFRVSAGKPKPSKAAVDAERRGPLRLDETGLRWWPRYFKPSPEATARKSFAS